MHPVFVAGAQYGDGARSYAGHMHDAVGLVPGRNHHALGSTEARRLHAACRGRRAGGRPACTASVWRCPAARAMGWQIAAVLRSPAALGQWALPGQLALGAACGVDQQRIQLSKAGGRVAGRCCSIGQAAFQLRQARLQIVIAQLRIGRCQ